MTWQTCLRFVTRRRVPVLATAPDRAETSTRVRPMHDLTRLEVLQLLLCNFRTGTRLRLDSFVPYIECSACAATPIAASQRHRPGRPIFLDLGAIPGLKTAPRPENSGPRPASFPGLGVLSRW